MVVGITHGKSSLKNSMFKDGQPGTIVTVAKTV